eukprot:Pgem_evm1s18826
MKTNFAWFVSEAHSLLITGKKEQIHLRIAELKFYGDLNRKINQELFSRLYDRNKEKIFRFFFGIRQTI